MIKNVLIFGANSRLGRILTQKSLEAGLFVSVFIKNNMCFETQTDHLEIIQGDILNYKDVERAVQGQDCVLCVLGVDETKAEIIKSGTLNIIHAMEHEKVLRLIGLSAIGAGSTQNKTSVLFSYKLKLTGKVDILEANTEQEKLLYKSRLSFSFIQVGKLTNENVSEGKGIKVLLPYQIRRVGLFGPAKVSRKQVATFVLQELQNPLWVRRTVCIYN